VHDALASHFEAGRPRLRDIAYRILGSFHDADDAVQETWIRLSRQNPADIENFEGWLATVVARICVDALRSRRAKREESLETQLPDFIVSRESDPEYAAVTADSLGLAATIVFESLTPAERVAFVLHDMFAVPFEQIAPIVERSEMATRQLASRARRRVRAADPPSTPFAQRKAIVESFVSAARDGDVERLLRVLDPEVLLRADREPALHGIRGARTVASQASGFARVVASMEFVVVNGEPGILSRLPNGEPLSVMGFVVVAERIQAMYVVSQPERLRHILAPASVYPA
jgi:RNA polymerase sigma-70 factor (ECF subfamily)